MKISKVLLPLALSVLIILGFSAIDFKNFTAFNSHEEESYKVYALKLPSNLDFSGEAVPLDQPDIRERLDKELLVNTYWQSNMMLLCSNRNNFCSSSLSIFLNFFI